MRDDTIVALARANKFLWTVLEADGANMSDVRRERYQRQPGLGLEQMQREVISRGIMDEDVVDMMSALVDAIDDQDVSVTESLPPTRQGTYAFEWMRFRDFDTMTVKEAADALGVSTQRVYRLIQEGKLLSVTMHGTRKVFTHQVNRRKRG